MLITVIPSAIGAFAIARHFRRQIKPKQEHNEGIMQAGIYWKGIELGRTDARTGDTRTNLRK